MKKKKEFDCVQMKHDIQRKLMKENAGLSLQERRRRLHKALAADPILGPWLKKIRSRELNPNHGTSPKEKSGDVLRAERVVKKKSFDCVKMKHDIQKKLVKELAGLSMEERRTRLEAKMAANPILGPGFKAAKPPKKRADK
jgi:hypothetical protein